MNRRFRAAAVFLLLLTAALPLAALPVRDQAEAPWESIAAKLWARMVPVLGLFEKSRAGMDPNGTPAPAPPPGDSAQAFDGDSRASMDPDG